MELGGSDRQHAPDPLSRAVQRAEATTGRQDLRAPTMLGSPAGRRGDLHYNLPMSFTSIQKIRFDDVDGAGIVYYPQFFHLCHAAFEDFFDTAAPISYPELITGRRLGFPTVALESEFTAPLEYGDVAVVELVVERVGRTSVSFRYLIRRKRDGARCFEAHITTVLINLDSRKPVAIPQELRSIFEGSLTPNVGTSEAGTEDSRGEEF